MRRGTARANGRGHQRRAARADDHHFGQRRIYDQIGHRLTYLGHVRVNDPDMKLACDWLAADLPPAGEHIKRIVAATNVVIDVTDAKGQAMHATSDRAVYDYIEKSAVTNETLTLTGNAKADTAQMTMTGEPIVWDRATGSMHGLESES